MFALGIFVLVASIIRAYYSKSTNDPSLIQLTLTVSMVEVSVAIIAASLPALRTLFLGHTSQVGTLSVGRHYELSSRRPGNGTHPQKYTGTTSGGTRKGQDSDSVDELVKGGAFVSSNGMPTDNNSGNMDGIMVETGFEISDKVDEDNRKRKIHSEV